MRRPDPMRRGAGSIDAGTVAGVGRSGCVLACDAGLGARSLGVVRWLLGCWLVWATTGCSGAPGLEGRAASRSEGRVRVVEAPQEGGLRLSVENTHLAAVTLTLWVTGENCVPDRAMPVVLSCPGPGAFPFVRIRPGNEREDFSYRVRYHWQFGQTGVRHDRGAEYRVPFASGVRARVSQGWGGTFTHSGNDAYAVDFDLPVGTAVHAAREGRVEVVVDEHAEGGLDPRLRDRVNRILIRHPDGTYGEYVHLQHRGARVHPGMRVAAGDFLGYSGNTGYSQGPHLHFAVFRAVDGERRETFPVRFRAREGRAVEPAEGRYLTAP
ncbi:MAG: M23 family metallopeptidase [Verrucomicrobiae bacterium]|nr:M23 family metallopeptidase [Verrucomicrobiae bacterium]